jgi:branched-chain amino acid aminotransferase
MAIPESKWIWMDGERVPWKDANIHVLSHVVHYGSGVFEGIRCYATRTGPAVFRLREHIRRLFDSARTYRMEIPYSADELVDATVDLIRENGLDECYIRPVAFRGYGTLGVNPLPCPVRTVIATWKWGAYLGEEAVENGVDVQVSSWNRMAPNTFPCLAKTNANYANSQLIKMEALTNGYVEGIALDVDGFVSEGSGENLFLIRDGRAYTPGLSSSILSGITRRSVRRLLREIDVEVEEVRLPREALYMADELFFTGTAAEITPIRSVDRIAVGGGKPGPITRKVQARFSAILRGEDPDPYGWLHPVAER